jgi:thioredoxin-related protein
MKKLFLAIIVIQIGACRSAEPNISIDNLAKGIVYAKEKKSKLFLVFDNYGSSTDYVDKILSDNEIEKALSHCVVVRLRCDNKKGMNDSLSIGEFNSNLQKEIVGEMYQPMFCFLDDTGKSVSPPLGYSKKEDLRECSENCVNQIF